MDAFAVTHIHVHTHVKQVHKPVKKNKMAAETENLLKFLNLIRNLWYTVFLRYMTSRVENLAKRHEVAMTGQITSEVFQYF